MPLFKNFDALTGACGDGLRPELRELLAGMAETNSNDKVRQLAHYRDTGFSQAGPNPAGSAAAGQSIVMLHPTAPDKQTRRRTI